jgi:hypothetical protein
MISEKYYTYEWREDGLSNISMTVALPLKRMGAISWVALESLRRQVDVDFDWELIVFEDGDSSRKTLDKFIGRLPGCKRILYRALNPEEEGRKSGPYKGNILLIDKWIEIAKAADSNSRVYCLQAGDVYSPNHMLKNHFKNFINKNCIFSTYPRGLFYHLGTKKKMFYDGYRADVKKNKKPFLTSMHLYMAVRTKDMLKVTSIDRNRKIDKHIRVSINKQHGIDPGSAKYIYNVDDIDPTDWMSGFNTDGLNTISYRGKIYENPSFFSRLWLPYSDSTKNKLNYGHDFEEKVPSNVLAFLALEHKTRKRR